MLKSVKANHAPSPLKAVSLLHIYTWPGYLGVWGGMKEAYNRVPVNIDIRRSHSSNLLWKVLLGCWAHLGYWAHLGAFCW